MLDDRVAAIARLPLRQEAAGPLEAPPLLPLARAPGSAGQGATTPTDRKSAWSDCTAGDARRREKAQQQQHEDGERTDRWRQVRTRVRRLMRGDGGHGQFASGGKRDGKPVTMLHRDFWLEALDEQHRYGCHLRAFHKVWKHETSGSNDSFNSPFFCWLDHGEGSTLDLPECSQEELRHSRVVYCSHEDRRQYELQFVPSSQDRQSSRTRKTDSTDHAHMSNDRDFVAEYAESHALAHTDERSKWIFVVDLAGHMYLGRKRKGRFHHSSFVAGAPVIAAGKIVIKLGRIIAIEPHSGHFKPKLASLGALRDLLERNGVDVDAVTFVKPKKWAGEWPFPALEESVDLDDFASDTDDCGSNAFFDTPGDLAGDNDGGGDNEQWPPASP